ncbi:MAG: hypothetical protein ACOCSL_03585 [Thermoplasmatota archaeon]
MNDQAKDFAGSGDYLLERIENDLSVEMPEGLKKRLTRYDRPPSERGLSTGERKLREILGQIIATRGNECYVNDNGLGYLDFEIVEDMLKFLPRTNIQMIFTISKEPDFEIESDYNVIKLEEE